MYVLKKIVVIWAYELSTIKVVMKPPAAKNYCYHFTLYISMVSAGVKL